MLEKVLEISNSITSKFSQKYEEFLTIGKNFLTKLYNGLVS
jgi:transcriptional antiterminator